MTELDRPYVLSTWVGAEEDHARIPGTRDEVFAALRAKANALLSRSRVLVASPDDVTVLAWLVVDDEKPLVHYAYTRREFRRHGLQRDLVRHAGLKSIEMTCPVPKRGALPRVAYHPTVGWMLAVVGRPEERP